MKGCNSSAWINLNIISKGIFILYSERMDKLILDIPSDKGNMLASGLRNLYIS